MARSVLHSRNVMLTICSWCQREVRSRERRQKSGAVGSVVHEICDRHAEAIFRSIQETIARRDASRARRE
jgi:hypothetical protein